MAPIEKQTIIRIGVTINGTSQENVKLKIMFYIFSGNPEGLRTLLPLRLQSHGQPGLVQSALRCQQCQQ